MTFYVFWAGAIALGALLAVSDRRWIGWPFLGLFPIAGLCGGLITTQVSPFNFADGGDYMDGVVVAAASAAALVGYGLANAIQFMTRHFRGRSRT